MHERDSQPPAVHETSSIMDRTIYDFTLRVLIYPEGGEFVAHALEMDLLGYGRTEKKAMNELTEMIQAQIQFARQKGNDSAILFPAPQDFFQRWEAAHSASLKQQVLGDKSGTLSVKAVIISFSKEELLKLLSSARRTLVREFCAETA